MNLHPIMTNLQLISLNGHLSSHLKNIPMHNNPTNIYIPRPFKATPFFIFKNSGMPSFLHSENLYQQKRSEQHTTIPNKNITTHIKFLLPPDTHTKFSTEKENYEAFSRALRVHPVKYDIITSPKSPTSHFKICRCT